jgi:hypothetical protein
MDKLSEATTRSNKAHAAYHRFVARLGVPTPETPGALASFQRLADEMEAADSALEALRAGGRR